MHLLFFVVTFNNWETVSTISLWHSLRCFVIDPLVMIGSLNQVSHVVTISLACYRLDLLQLPVIERPQMALNWNIKFWFCCFSWWRLVTFIVLVICAYWFHFTQGTRSALYGNDRESITVTVQEVTPRTVGALIALYERAVGIYAALVNINAYHQPGKYLLTFAHCRNFWPWSEI